MASIDIASASLIGEVIGQRFLIRERLDDTGQADVYRAEHVLIHRDVALKVARTGLDPGEQVVARFQRVARVATQIDHPNCIKISDFGLDERGYVFLAMELAAGRDLQRILDEDGPLTPEEVVGIGLQILEGLGEAHRRGILHTELHPRYVMVDLATGTPAVKVLGFGLGRLMRGIEEGRATHEVRDEAARFAAPELLRPFAPADHRADLFAVAAVLYTALTGKNPWPEATEPGQRMDQSPVRPSQVRNDGSVSMGLDRLLVQALDPDPGRRYSDAVEMASALRRCLQDDPEEVSAVEAVHRTFGRYKLLRIIAQGGMGELHLAASETLPGISKVCALKRLRSELAAEKSYVDRFLSEARLAAQLSHPNLATVYDVGKAEDHFYMAMEYVVGKDCRRIIDRARDDGVTIPLDVALYIARELADALAYAHRIRLPGGEVGLIHRDVSPTNVLVSYEGQVKLIDFGLAKHATSAGKTETGVVIGKVAYMAPEQCLGEPLDGRADIYSVGAVLFELLTGKRVREVDDYERLAEIVNTPPERMPGQIRPGLPAAVDRVVARALAVAPEQRYRHAEGLRDDLSVLLEQANHRISRDVVAAFVRGLFPAEQKSETERAQVAATQPAPLVPDSALGPDDEDGARGATMAMPVVSPASMGLGGDDTFVAPGPAFGELETTHEVPVVSVSAMGEVAGGEPVRASQPSPAGDATAPGWRPGWGIALLLLLVGLGGGFGIRHMVLTELGDRPVARRAPAQEETARPASPPPPPREARPAEPPPAPTPPRPSREELDRAADSRAEKRVRERLKAIAQTELTRRGVHPAELPALPALRKRWAGVAAAVMGEDLQKALATVAEFAKTLESRDFECKRLRRQKFRYSRKLLKALRRKAPRKRSERKAYFERIGYASLKERFETARKRAGDDKLTCPEKSLAYQELIPDLLKAEELASSEGSGKAGEGGREGSARPGGDGPGGDDTSDPESDPRDSQARSSADGPRARPGMEPRRGRPRGAR